MESLTYIKLLGWISAFAGKKGFWVFPEEAKADIRNPVTHIQIITPKVISLLFFILFTTIAFAQTAIVVFQSKDSIPFQVSINHIKQHQSYNNSVRINQLIGNRSYNVKINFENDTSFVQQNIYLVDDGLAHLYFVTQKAIVLKKIVPAATYPKAKNQLEITYLKNTAIPLNTLTKDSIQEKDTAYVVPFASYYKLENYNGKIGCPFPIKDTKLAKLKGVILTESLEESKLEKVKIAIQEMDSACIMIKQLKELIVLFEYEETKLDFAKFVSNYLFDIDNIGKLTDIFDFENSMDELKEKIGM